jgi:hypothetical protein
MEFKKGPRHWPHATPGRSGSLFAAARQGPWAPNRQVTATAARRAMPPWAPRALWACPSGPLPLWFGDPGGLGDTAGFPTDAGHPQGPEGKRLCIMDPTYAYAQPNFRWSSRGCIHSFKILGLNSCRGPGPPGRPLVRTRLQAQDFDRQARALRPLKPPALPSTRNQIPPCSFFDHLVGADEQVRRKG